MRSKMFFRILKGKVNISITILIKDLTNNQINVTLKKYETTYFKSDLFFFITVFLKKNFNLQKCYLYIKFS